jgi:hypothetical protein
MPKALHKDTVSMPSNIAEATATKYGLALLTHDYPQQQLKSMQYLLN